MLSIQIPVRASVSASFGDKIKRPFNRSSGIFRYTGNYDKFQEMYAIYKAQRESAYERQQQEIAKLEDFVARNKARVATTNMAKSRQRTRLLRTSYSRNLQNIRTPLIFLRKMATYSCFGVSKI